MRLGKFIACVAVFVGLAFSGARAATPEEAQALLNEAIAHYNSAGQEQAFKDFSDPSGKFIRGELYIVAQKISDGSVLLHAVNPKLNGRMLMDLKDPTGKLFVAEMVEIAKTSGEGFSDYKWVNPVTKKIADKRSYVKKVADDVFFLVGYYK